MPAPSGNDLGRQYDRAVDEYRFQVNLNWRRSEYFFVLNVGVLIAAATMFSSKDVPRVLVAVLFFVGALLAALSFLANDVQHRYYQSARERKRAIEDALELKDLALATTPGMGSPLARLGKVALSSRSCWSLSVWRTFLAPVSRWLMRKGHRHTHRSSQFGLSPEGRLQLPKASSLLARVRR